MSFAMRGAIKVWSRTITTSGHKYHPGYEAWAKKHLGTNSDISRKCQLMKVVALGDIREHPNSSSKSVDWLRIGSVALVDGIVISIKDRTWVRLLSSDDHPKGWTALKKRDGTLKLVQLKSVEANPTSGVDRKSRSLEFEHAS